MSAGYALKGQVNPFEMSGRSAADSSANNAGVPVAAANPFELIPMRGGQVEEAPVSQAAWKKKVYRLFELRSKPSEVRSMLFWFLLFLTLLLAIAVNLNRGIVAKLYKTSFNLNLFNMLYRENREENRLIFPLLNLLYVAAMSTFAYLASIAFKESNYSFLLLLFAAVMTGVYLVRYVSLRLLAFIFGLDKAVDHYMFNIVCFGSLMAIIFIPIDFIVAFSRPDWARSIIVLAVVFYALAYFFRQTKEILASANLWSRSVFHFLLYLCAFEFAPLVFLIVYIHRQGWV